MKSIITWLSVLLLFSACESKSRKEFSVRQLRTEGTVSVHDATKTRHSSSNTSSINTRRRNIKKNLYEQVDQSKEYFVYKVIDGDTFWMEDSLKNQIKVRLIGIDAPETRNTRYKKKGYFAQESKAYMQNVIGNKYVKVELDVQRQDKYGRLLAYVFTAEKTFVNAALVENGFAVVSTFPPNVKYTDQFIALQSKARAAQIGMWK